MTNNANLSPAFGSDLLLRSVAELRELYGIIFRQDKPTEPG